MALSDSRLKLARKLKANLEQWITLTQQFLQTQMGIENLEEQHRSVDSSKELSKVVVKSLGQERSDEVKILLKQRIEAAKINTNGLRKSILYFIVHDNKY